MGAGTIGGHGWRRRQLILWGAAGLAAARVAPGGRAVAAEIAPVPASAYLMGDRYMETYRQKYALSYEYAATHTALRFLGYDVPEDAMRVLLGAGEDPDETFRGNIQAWQTLSDYGVHARGLVRLLDLLKTAQLVPARLEGRLLYDLDAVRQALAVGEPVIVWLPLALRPSSRVPVRLSTGKVVHLVHAEHTVTLRGYADDQFLALEPSNGTAPIYDAAALWRGMSLFDDPAVAIRLPPTPPPVPTSQYFSETDVTLDGGFYQWYRELGGREALGVPLAPEFYEPDLATGADRTVVYTEHARLEWSPQTGAFGLGHAGQEYLGAAAAPSASACPFPRKSSLRPARTACSPTGAARKSASGSRPACCCTTDAAATCSPAAPAMPSTGSVTCSRPAPSGQQRRTKRPTPPRQATWQRTTRPRPCLPVQIRTLRTTTAQRSGCSRGRQKGVN